MKKEITALAKSLKISEIGFVSADFYLERAEKIKKSSSLCASGSEKEALFGAKTIIVCSFSYYTGCEEGNISMYARGTDYHLVIKEKLQRIVDKLTENGYSASAFADVGALNERLLAKLSGIAFIGENQMAISEKTGSYFFVGYVITDCPLPQDKENEKKCKGCGRCRKVCPLGALDNGFCEEKCISYITQKKGELTPAEIEAMQKVGTIWGCDECQRVCPHNKGLPVTDIDEFKTDLIYSIDMEEDISAREFKRRFGKRAFSWRGKSVIKRNYDAIYNKKKLF